jgi:hypothetical protein
MIQFLDWQPAIFPPGKIQALPLAIATIISFAVIASFPANADDHPATANGDIDKERQANSHARVAGADRAAEPAR